MTNLHLTRQNMKKGHMGHQSPAILARNEYRESLETSAPPAPNDLPTDCWHCGGYLPRRLRTGGIHQLCANHYDELTEQKP